MSRRVLFVAEAVTLAHVARCVALSGALSPASRSPGSPADGYETVHAWDSRYDGLVGGEHLPLWTIPSRQFTSALHRGSPIYREKDLIRYVAEDRALIEQVKPDVVVGDFRLSLSISARLAGVPYVAIANAYWSPHATVKPPLPDGVLADLVGVRLGQRLFDLGTPAVTAWHARAFRRLHKRFGLPYRPRDIREVYTDGDTTLYADIEELVPMPPGYQLIGPVLWSPAVPEPELPTGRPLVYVSLGSSGRGDRLSTVLTALADLPVTVVAATAGAPPPDRVPANAHVVPMLPADRVVPKAALVIGNGGSPSTYQALSHGKPVLGICTNLDQYLNMSLVERANAGILLRAGRLSTTDVRRAVLRLLDAVPLSGLAKAIAQYDSGERFRETIRRVA